MKPSEIDFDREHQIEMLTTENLELKKEISKLQEMLIYPKFDFSIIKTEYEAIIEAKLNLDNNIEYSIAAAKRIPKHLLKEETFVGCIKGDLIKEIAKMYAVRGFEYWGKKR